MDSGILMQQDSILVCSPNLRIPHTANCLLYKCYYTVLLMLERHLIVVNLVEMSYVWLHHGLELQQLLSYLSQLLFEL
jgi:hypothetical protein